MKLFLCLTGCALSVFLACGPSAAGGGDSSPVNPDIVRAIALHSYTFDGRELETWADLFAEDATTNVYPPGSNTPSWTSTSRQELLDAARHHMANDLKDTQSRHHSSDILFLETSDTSAKTRHTVLVTHRSTSDAAPRIAVSGTYVIEWKRIDGAWVIARRDFYTD